MATSSKFDPSCGSPDRPLLSSGQRGSYMHGTMDRSNSFRESTENPALYSIPNTSRSSSTVTQGDVMSFFQCMRFDPKLLASEHKFSRQMDFQRHISVALGISQDDSSSISVKGKQLASPEELKNVKAGLRDCSIKARGRLKIFNEALSVLNKFFPNKKRSRSDVFSSQRSSTLLSGERSVQGPKLGKIRNHSHPINIGFELEMQKPEERSKNVLPNKRSRNSSIDGKMDVQSKDVCRPPGALDRDREMVKLANSGAVQGEDQIVSVGIDALVEKLKTKKKRSGIKPDVSSGTLPSKPNDAYRGPKHGMQQRPVTDARARLNNDFHAFRPGVANGTVGIGKTDGISHHGGLGVHASSPRLERDNHPLHNDRRDRPFAPEKERVNLKSVNKATVHEDFDSASSMSNTKMNPFIRAPRSGSGMASKLSPVVHRAAVASDWEPSHCTNKPVAAVGTSNRKRMGSTRSPSPPVAQWAGQRPQKISRTARTNFVPIVSSNDEGHATDSISDSAGNENALRFSRHLPGNSPQQVKLKGEAISSAALSDSEESGAAEVKSKDKVKKSIEIEERAGHNVKKVSTVLLPSRKNKVVSGADSGDCIRRQGRTGRGYGPRTVEKLTSAGTPKQLRSTRLGLDKTESKAARPPSRKLSDHKPYTRQRITTVNPADFLVGSDDGQAELLSAANAVISYGSPFPSSFWRQMEPFFRWISDQDIDFLKQQGNIGSTTTPPTSVSLYSDRNTVPNGFGLTENRKGIELTSETRGLVSLSQRLISALIPESEIEELSSSVSEDLEFDTEGSGLELDGELDSEALNSPVSIRLAGRTGNRERDELEGDILGTFNTDTNTYHSPNSLLPHQASMSSLACSELQYQNMSVNEKLLLELQSIGISPEPVSYPQTYITQTEHERISTDIRGLEEKYRVQVTKKKSLLDRVVKSSLEMKEIQQKDFEQRALDKLIMSAYEKYMTCWGPSATTGGKSSSSKMAKLSALAFVKRSMEQCHKFEATSKSCFSEPLFRDMFISGLSHLNVQLADTIVRAESYKQHGKTSAHSFNSRASASTHSPLPMESRDTNSSDVLLREHHPSEQNFGKEDTCSNRVKKRELLLDDVIGGTIGASSNAPLGFGSSLSSSTKGKRTERDREGKAHTRDVLSINGNTKIGRSTVPNIKGERKSKAKTKQKITQLSVSVNGLIGKASGQPKSELPSVSKLNGMAARSNTKEMDEFSANVPDDHEPIDLSHLQLPGMDVLGVPDDIGDQNQDLDSWLNIEDDGLHGNDFIGLEIPMDDLSDLNMMV